MTIYSKTPYSIAFKTDCVERHDMFRDSIVSKLKTYATASNYEEKYMLTIREKGLYERIRKDMMDGKVKDTNKYLQSYDLVFNKFLLDKIKYEDGELLFYVHNYHSLPPDYGALPLSEIPTKVLYHALSIFQDEQIKDLTEELKRRNSNEFCG